MPLTRQPQRHRPDAGRVDQPAAVVGHGEQLGGDGGVAAAVVAAHLGRRLALLAEEGVDERRLADAAGAEERHRSSRTEHPAQLVEPAVASSAGHEHGHAEGDLLQLPSPRLGVVDEVALGEQDDRVGAAVEGQHELALEAALVRRHGEGVAEEDDVDVGGERVGDRPRPFERRPADERRAALEHVLDALAVGRRHDPVADGDVGTDVADPVRARPPSSEGSSVLQPRSMRQTRAGAPGARALPTPPARSSPHPSASGSLLSPRRR